MHAGLPRAGQGEPLLPGPVLAAPYHLRGAADAAPYGYGRDENPTWTHLERALGELDGGEAVVFASGMAAVDRGRAAAAAARATCSSRAATATRASASSPPTTWRRTASRSGSCRPTPSAIVAAADGATLVWVETPSNPRLDVVDLDAVAAAAHAAGALLAVDNTLATPLGQRPLDHGADFAMLSGTKSLSGHSDLLLGAVSVRDPALAAELRAWRSRDGRDPRPVRGVARPPLAGDARAAARALAGERAARWPRRSPARDDVTGVRWPGVGPVDRAGRAAVRRARRRRSSTPASWSAEATSFGGVHSTAERRARWGTDDVPEGFIRFSAGCEDTADLVADVRAGAPTPTWTKGPPGRRALHAV